VNVIIIFLDSFRQDHASVYNQGRAPFKEIASCKTPNIDEFAKECVVFENAYPEALPTMPVRLQVMTGQRTLPSRGWEPMKPNDVPIQRILGEQGYISGFITDVYHFRAPGMNYHAGFDCYRWIHGQECDPWVSSPPKRNIDDYVNQNYPEIWRNRIIKQFLANTDDFSSEEDWFPAKVVEEACGWLKANRCHEKTLLWIDSFDPHEPWDPPKDWDTYTDSNYKGKRLIMPMGELASKWASPEEIKHIQGLYAGEVSFVDHCLGKLFQCLDEEGYMDDSLIFLLADHGHPLADHGKFLKGPDRMYSELLKVPFLVHLPGGDNKGMRTDALVSFHDILPTILELMGQKNNTEAMHGKSFVPVLKGKTNEHRQAIITGYHEGFDRCIRDKKWSYIARPDEEPDEFYNIQDDPRETKNMIDECHQEALRLSKMFGSYFYRIPRLAIKGLQGRYEMASGKS
jgi:arylsulfatase A-like enzyme